MEDKKTKKTDILEVVSDMPFQWALTWGFGKDGRILAGWAPVRTLEEACEGIKKAAKEAECWVDDMWGFTADGEDGVVVDFGHHNVFGYIRGDGVVRACMGGGTRADENAGAQVSTDATSVEPAREQLMKFWREVARLLREDEDDAARYGGGWWRWNCVKMACLIGFAGELECRLDDKGVEGAPKLDFIGLHLSPRDVASKVMAWSKEDPYATDILLPHRPELQDKAFEGAVSWGEE